jgi:GNAT superfamily N-acetyltransferase
VTIIYRTYEPGDEEHGLVEAFNLPFQGLGGGYLRTPKRIRWRYIDEPGAKPGEINVAVDGDTGKIVSAVYGTIEHYQFDGVQKKVGAINDVGTIPGYTGKGIARKLLVQAHAFMEAEECEFSVLSADANGFPRSRLYLPLGYQDFFKEGMYTSILGNDPSHRLLPALVALQPALTFSWMARSARIASIKRRLAQLDVAVQQVVPKRDGLAPVRLSREIWAFHERVAPRQYDGATSISLDAWVHFREHPVGMDLAPVYVVIKMGGKIVGYSVFLPNWIHSFKTGMKFKLASGHEFLVNHAVSHDPSIIADLYTLLAEESGAAADAASCLAMIFLLTPGDRPLERAFKTARFLNFPRGAFMIKPLGSNGPNIPCTSKIFLSGPGESFAYP